MKGVAMTEMDYSKYLIDKPVCEPGQMEIKNRQPTMTYVSNELFPGCNHHVSLDWITGMPDPATHIYEHVHDYDEVVVHWGGNYHTPQVLGGEVEFYIAGQPITFNTTTAIFIPKGTRHGPVTWKKFDFPHIQMALRIGNGDREDDNSNGMRQVRDEIPKKTEDFDYEQYVVRSPNREMGNPEVKDRQPLTMTYMSNRQVNDSNIYLEFSWIWGTPNDGIHEMVHENFEEIVLHIGGDPENPEDLGADMDFGIGGVPQRVNRSYAVYLPKGMSHGPLFWHETRVPHIEMAMMIGAGSAEEGWEGSGIDGPGK
jgi:hypothetical protein